VYLLSKLPAFPDLKAFKVFDGFSFVFIPSYFWKSNCLVAITFAPTYDLGLAVYGR